MGAAGDLLGRRIAASYAAMAALFAEYAGGSGGLADSIRSDQLDTAAGGRRRRWLLALLALALFGIVVAAGAGLRIPWAREAR